MLIKNKKRIPFTTFELIKLHSQHFNFTSRVHQGMLVLRAGLLMQTI